MSATANPLRVGVVGCGRMGRHHVKAYTNLPNAQLAGVFDVDSDSASAAAEEFGCQAFNSLEQIVDAVDAVTIAVPTKYHVASAEPFLKVGKACLIEKPIAGTVAEAEHLVAVARQHNAVLQVGHIERFNPAFLAMQKLNIRPRFIEVVRISPLTFRSIDVGVVLDMMIHDIDLVLQLAAAEPDKIDAVGVSVIGDVEDICNARITFANGCVANLTASRLALKTERRIRVFSTDAYVSVDYQKRYGMVAKRGENVGAIRQAVAQIRSGEIEDLSQLNFMDLINVQELEINEADPLRAELTAFVEAAAGRGPIAVTGEQGVAAVALATKIVESIAPHSLEA